jgi:hypothetical protein
MVRATTCTHRGRCTPAATGSAPARRQRCWQLASSTQASARGGCHNGCASSIAVWGDRERAPWLTHGHGEANELCDVCSQLQTVVVHRSPLAPSSNSCLIHVHCVKAVDCAPRVLSLPPFGFPETGHAWPLGRARAIHALGRAAGPSLHRHHESGAEKAGSASADAL